MPAHTHTETDSDRLVRILRENETIVYILPLDALILETETARETKCRASPRRWPSESVRSVAGSIAPLQDLKTLYQMLKELGLQGRAITKVVKGKTYVILKGHPGKRELLRGTRYLASHPTIVRLAIGPKALLKSVKNGSVLTAALYTGLDVLEYLFSDAAGLHTLLGNVTADLAKVGIASVCSALAGLGVGFAAVVGTFPAVPFVVSIGVGIGVGYYLDKLDKRYGATKALIDYYESLGDDLNTTWDQIGALPETIASEVVKWEKYMIRSILKKRSYGY